MKNPIALFVVTIAAVLTACADEDQGGYLTLWPKNHGSFVFVNAQDAIATDVLQKPVKRLGKDTGFDIQLKSGKPVDIRAVQAELSALNAKGAIWVVHDAALPLVLAACENQWAILNVAPILADKPDAAKIDARLIRLIYRLFANIHGASDPTMMPQCVMKPAIGLRGIDSLVCRDYSPETFSKVTSFMDALGYKSCKTGTYLDACEEGWAPLPTNAVQKAIWEKVHKLPTEPIKIGRESERK